MYHVGDTCNIRIVTNWHLAPYLLNSVVNLTIRQAIEITNLVIQNLS